MRKKIRFFRSVLLVCLSFFLVSAGFGDTLFADEGAPDAYGYRWTDNKYPEPTIPFEWTDITPTGNLIEFSGDDSVTVNIGFDFTFYGAQYSTITIGDNGYLTFGSTGNVGNNVSIPNSAAPNSIIAPFWDNLGYYGIQVYYETTGTAPDRRFVAEWYQAAHYDDLNDSPMTFEVILEEGTNNIFFYYKEMDSYYSTYPRGISATVGIENSDGTDGVLYSFNSMTLSDSIAIGISTTPVTPADEDIVDLNFAMPADPTTTTSTPAIPAGSRITGIDYSVTPKTGYDTYQWDLTVFQTGNPDQFYQSICPSATYACLPYAGTMHDINGWDPWGEWNMDIYYNWSSYFDSASLAIHYAYPANDPPVIGSIIIEPADQGVAGVEPGAGAIITVEVIDEGTDVELTLEREDIDEPGTFYTAIGPVTKTITNGRITGTWTVNDKLLVGITYNYRITIKDEADIESMAYKNVTMVFNPEVTGVADLEWPFDVTAMPETALVTSSFGERRPTVGATATRFHAGIDIDTDNNLVRAVSPVAKGVVTAFNEDGENDTGEDWVTLEHNIGGLIIYSKYVHIDIDRSNNNWIKKQIIRPTQKVGTIAADADGGNHLHLSIKEGDDYINPLVANTTFNTTHADTGLPFFLEAANSVTLNDDGVDINVGLARDAAQSTASMDYYTLCAGCTMPELYCDVAAIARARDFADAFLKKGVYSISLSYAAGVINLPDEAFTELYRIQFDAIDDGDIGFDPGGGPASDIIDKIFGTIDPEWVEFKLHDDPAVTGIFNTGTDLVSDTSGIWRPFMLDEGYYTLRIVIEDRKNKKAVADIPVSHILNYTQMLITVPGVGPAVPTNGAIGLKTSVIKDSNNDPVPDGTEVTFTSGDGTIMPYGGLPAIETVNGIAHAIFIASGNAGKATINASTGTTSGKIEIDVTSGTEPSIVIANPPAQGAGAWGDYTINWIDGDNDSDATITFYYDNDNQGFDGVEIVGGISEDDPGNSYTWDVSSLPEGAYYVYAEITDGVDTTRMYSVGQLTVENLLVSIAVTPVDPSIILGATQQFSATGTYQNGDTNPVTPAWLSNNTVVSTIDTNGLATSVGVGSADITASLDGITSSPTMLRLTLFGPKIPK